MIKKNKFKQTEIGRIPEDWHEITLGKLVTFQRGHDLPAKERTEGRYPIIASNGIVGYHNEFKAKGHGVTIGRSGNLGEPFFIKQDYWPHNTTLYSIEFHNSEPLFVYYFLKTLNLKTFNAGSAVPTLNRNHIHPIEIVVPKKIVEQRAIASILGSLDDKIALNRSMNSTLEAIGQAVFRRWFVDFEFPDGEGKPYRSSGGEMVETELGEVPRGWKIQDLYSCAEYINGEAFRNDDFSLDHSGFPIIKIVELKYGITSQTEFTNRDADPKYKINNGDILFSWSGSPDTSIDTFIWTGGSGWLNQHIFKVTPHNPYEKQFVYFLLHYHKQTFIEIARDKQTTGLGHVTIKDLKRILFVIPPNKIMELFENVAGPLFNQMLCNSLESSTLSAIRDALLPKLMSGEVRVITNNNLNNENK